MVALLHVCGSAEVFICHRTLLGQMFTVWLLMYKRDVWLSLKNNGFIVREHSSEMLFVINACAKSVFWHNQHAPAAKGS